MLETVGLKETTSSIKYEYAPTENVYPGLEISPRFDFSPSGAQVTFMVRNIAHTDESRESFMRLIDNLLIEEIEFTMTVRKSRQSNQGMD